MKYLKNKKDYLNYVVTFYVLLNVLYVFVSSFLFTQNIIYYSHYGKSMIGALILNVVFIIVMFIIRKIEHIKFKFQIYDLLIILMSIFAIISCFFAISKYAALYGFYLRYEGVFAILYYFSIFYISTFVKKEHKKIIAYAIITTGVINSMYGFLQSNMNSHVKIFYKLGEPVITGFNNNPNFFATYMLLSLSYAVGLFIDEERTDMKVLFGMSIVILSIGFVIANTRSCVVGLFFVFVYGLIFCIKNKKYKELVLSALLIISVLTYLQINNKTNLVGGLIGSKNEAVKLLSGDSNNNFGAKRLGVWKYSLMIAPHYFLHGAGIDNFVFAFGGRPIMVGGYSFDKAHNEYIQILITEGLFALISYLVLIISVLFSGIKTSMKDKSIYLILPVIGYLVQAFFNISVIDVAPIFYISMGLAITRKK